MKNQQTDDRKKLIGDEARIVLLGILAAAMWVKIPTFRYCMFFLFFIPLQPNSISSLFPQHYNLIFFIST